MPWITVGTLAAATDPSMAALIRHPNSESRAAVVETLGPAIADEVAAAPTVVAAAASAVGAALSEADVLTRPDLVGTSTAATHRFVSPLGKNTWLGVAPNGGPDDTAIWAIKNYVTHEHKGPDAPFVYPGNWIDWYRTDENGDVVEETREWEI